MIGTSQLRYYQIADLLESLELQLQAELRGSKDYEIYDELINFEEIDKINSLRSKIKDLKREKGYWDLAVTYFKKTPAIIELPDFLVINIPFNTILKVTKSFENKFKGIELEFSPYKSREIASNEIYQLTDVVIWHE